MKNQSIKLKKVRDYAIVLAIFMGNIGYSHAEALTICPDDIMTAVDEGECTAKAVWTVLPPADNPGAAVVCTHESGDVFPIGTTTVSCTSMNAAGEELTCTFDITVNECEEEELVEKEITLIVDSDLPVGVDDTEDFEGVTYLFTDPATPANATITNISIDIYFRVQYASCESDIEVRLSDPAGNVVYQGTPFTTCNGSGSNPFPGELYIATIPIPNATTTGNIANWVAEFRDTDDQNPNEVEYTVRFGKLTYETKYTIGGSGENCGNPLIVNCPESVNQATNVDCGAVVNIPEPIYNVDFTDCFNATAVNDYTGSSDASGFYPVGTTVVTWTFTDQQGNTSTCEQTITITGEGGNATLECSENIIATTNVGECTATATWIEPVFDDCSGSATMSSTHNSGDEFPIGTTTVTYTATGGNGNELTCSFEVIVEECAAPPPVTTSLAAPDDGDIFIGENDTENFADNPTLVFTDPGTPADAVLTNIILKFYFRIFGNSCESDIEIRLTDPLGNVTTFNNVYTTCMGEGPLYEIQLNVPSGMTAGTVANWVAEFRDTNDQNAGESEYSVRWGSLCYDTVVSSGGCANPTIINCPQNVTVAPNAEDCSAFVAIPEPQFGQDFTDCTNATMTNSYNGTSDASGTYPWGTTIVVWTATDTQGNTAACAQLITVEDAETFLLNCPSDITVLTTPGMCSAIATWDDPLFANDCFGSTGGGIMNSTRESGDEFPIGTTTVMYTATDGQGNELTCSFEVIVEECTSPPPQTTSIATPDDDDFFIGENDTENFADNPTLLFTDSGTPAAAILTNIRLELYFRVFGNSCENDIEVRLIDPVGNTNIFTPFSSCNGEGPLYFIELYVPSGATTGTADDWVAEFRDTNDQNAGEAEYSVRWGRLSYDTAVDGGGCADPSIVNCPQSISVPPGANGCNAFVQIPEPQFGVDFIDCTNATITNSYNSTSNASDTYPIGITTVIWTTTDPEGNSSTCAQTIIVEDTQAPSVTCPANIVVEALPGMCGAEAVWDIPQFTDNCGASVAYVSHDSGEMFSIGTTTVTYNIADDAGNTAVCSFDVIIEECASPPPVTTSLATPDDEDIFIGENDTENFADNPTLIFTDPGTPANAVLTNIKLELYFRVFGNSCENDIEVRLTDPAGNMNVFTPFTTCMGEGPLYFIELNVPSGATTGLLADWVVELRDTNDQNAGESEYSVRWGRLSYDTVVSSGGCADPVIVNCPQSMTVQPGADGCNAFVDIPQPQFGVDFTDCTDATMTNSYNGTSDASDTYPSGTTTILWTATDEQGNVATCIQTITVEESETLTLTCSSDISAVTMPGMCAAAVTWDPPLLSNDCSGSNGGVINGTHQSGDEFPIGTTTVTYTAMDGQGNELTCSFEVIVEECASPPPVTTSLATPDDEDIFIGENDTESFLDNPTLIFTDPGTPANAVLTNIKLELYFRVFGNSCENDIEVRLTDPAGNSNVFTPFSTCTGEGPLYFIELNVPSASTTGTIADWVAEFRDTNDQNAGESEYSVRWGRLSYDTVVSGGGCADPVIVNCPPSISVPPGADGCNAFVNIPEPQFGVDFTDCTSATIVNSFNSTSNASDTYPIGTTTIIWTATDTEGNIATCAQNITVEDTQAPSVDCPDDIVLEIQPGMCDATVTWDTPQFLDNCGAYIAGVSHNSGDTFPIGTTTVTYNIADDAGNTAVCSFDVIVEECVSPPPVTTSLATPDDQDIFIGVNDTESFADNPTLIFTDPGTPASAVLTNIKLELYFRVFGNSCENDMEVRLTDPIGNSNVFTPFTTCMGEGPLYFIELNVPSGATTGAIADWVVEFRDTDDQNVGEWEYSVRWGRLSYDTVVSSGGCSDPVIVNCPENIMADSNTGDCGAFLNIPEPQFGIDFTDCTSATITNNYTSTSNASGNYPPGTTNVLWTATDSEGNMTTCVQTITVTGGGGQVSELICPDDITADAGSNCEAQVFWQAPQGNGDCGLTVTSTADPGDIFSLGTTTVTYTATDSTGNVTMCSFEIRVEDNTAPTTVCPSDMVLDAEAGICGAMLDNIITPLYEDNCGMVTVQSTSHTTSDVLPIGTTTVSYILADDSGNTRLCNYNVTVNDQNAPLIVNCPSDISTIAPPGECETLLTIPVPMFGTDYTDCQEATMMINDYNGTSNASGAYPVGTTTIVWTATDPDGNADTCEQIITVDEQSLNTEQMLVTDQDVYVGANADNADFHQSDSILINDPGVPNNATINFVILDFFFSPEGNSCERDVELEVTDPSGNVFPVFAAPTNTCNGTDAIFQFTLPTVSVPPGGGVWKLRFRDTDDQNPVSAGSPGGQAPAGTEYTVRFGRITYNVTIIPDCDPMLLVNEENNESQQPLNSSIHQLINTSTQQVVSSLKLFPVPTADQLNIEYFSNENNNIYIEIINTNGQIIHSETKNTVEGKNTLQMELQDLPEGLYYLKLRDNKGHIQAKPFTKM